MKPLCTLLLLAALCGCATQTVLLNKDLQRDYPDYTQRRHFLFWGFGSGDTQESAVDPAKICFGQERIIKIQRTINPIEAFYTVVSAGIYMPQTTLVFCRR